MQIQRKSNGSAALRIAGRLIFSFPCLLAADGIAALVVSLRMLHQMSRIFRENAAQPAIYAGMQIDKKRRRRLQEKRMAMGHKADDHEDRGLTQQTQ